MKISYIIPYRNREQIRLDNCLNSLHNQTYKNIEIVLSIYGGEIPKLPDWNNLLVIYQETEGIWNRAKALNNGIKRSSGEIIVTTDVDMIFSPNVAEKTVNLIKRRKESFVYSNFVMMEKEDWLEEPIHNSKESLNKFIKSHNHFTMKGTGGYQGMLRKYWFNVKGFKETYKGWGVEDIDLRDRAIKQGLRYNLLTDTIVLHQWHESEIQKAKLNNDKEFFGAISRNNNNQRGQGVGDL